MAKTAGSDDARKGDGAPPHLTVPDGTMEEQSIWLRTAWERGIASPLVEGSLDELFEGAKRRGRERLAQSKRAA